MDNKKINGEYLAGFVDGEGCFSLSFRKDKGKYFYWKIQFAIELRKDDKELLEKIKEYLNCGSCFVVGDNARYQLTDTEILYNKIIPLFEKHSLIGKKRYDFYLWKKAVGIIYKNKRKKINSSKGLKGFQINQWDLDDLKKLSEIRQQMQTYKCGGRNRILKY